MSTLHGAESWRDRQFQVGGALSLPVPKLLRRRCHAPRVTFIAVLPLLLLLVHASGCYVVSSRLPEAPFWSCCRVVLCTEVLIKLRCFFVGCQDRWRGVGSRACRFSLPRSSTSSPPLFSLGRVGGALILPCYAAACLSSSARVFCDLLY
jgi:hypothetical protein